MSKIERIELFHVSVPLDRPFYPSWIPGYPQTHNRFTLLRLTTDDGIVGVSAGNAFSKERQGLGELLGKFLIGMPADDLRTIRMRLREASYLGWRNWWIEAAFWDLLGKIQGKPVYKLLQPKEETVEQISVYASTGEVRSFEQRLGYLDEIRRMGFMAIKLRIKDPKQQDDVSILKKVRKELGDGFTLAVDANQGWPVSLVDKTPIWDLEYATRIGKVCDELSIAWLEEPLDMHDWDGMQELRKRIHTPLAGGELHGDWHEVRPLFEHECLDKYQPDATFCGGLSVSKRVMQECRKRKLKFSPHTWTNGIGLIINMHAFCAWEERDYLEYPLEPPGWVPEKREGVIAPQLVTQGRLQVPQEPGLGIQIDERLLKKHGELFYAASPIRIAIEAVLDKGLKTALELNRMRKNQTC